MLSIGTPQIKLLEKLCNAMSVSGDEGEVRRMVLEEVKPYADEVKVDALGSVLVRKKGAGKKPLRVMLDAHMDEVGFMIVSDDEDGFYQFECVGGIDERHLVGKQVIVGKDHTVGVIGAKPIHLTTASEREHAVSVDSMRIDLGPDGRAKVGDRATFATKFKRVGPSIMSKSIDDRIGVAILIELLKHAPKNIELCLSFSVQEEIGLRGAKVAAHYFAPDLAIAVDSTPARDLPDYEGRENYTYNTQLGLGPAIYMANSSTMDDPRLVRFLAETAEKNNIQYQFRQPGGGGTDAGAIQQSRAGVPVVSVSVPHRYTHSPISISRVDDWKNTLNLLHIALQKMTPALLEK
ncbi:MAG: M20/M25/M40 family metallo-hydrolase [Anaerolineales bacterium]|nr:M20/M25/M40 family metallo-hydrolase [Anaerolineales bacterium]MBP6207868.1 M20/M25/M40 family metallo-hydrolase [Anaerolineales bacterium]